MQLNKWWTSVRNTAKIQLTDADIVDEVFSFKIDDQWCKKILGLHHGGLALVKISIQDSGYLVPSPAVGGAQRYIAGLQSSDHTTETLASLQWLIFQCVRISTVEQFAARWHRLSSQTIETSRRHLKHFLFSRVSFPGH